MTKQLYRVGLAALLPAWLAACGSQSGAHSGRKLESVQQWQRVERSYLTARREQRTCQELKNTIEVAFARHDHGAALDAAELVMSLCPAEKLVAVENTMVILADSQATAATSPSRSVRLRVAQPLPARQRLLWLAAYADGKLGLNNLAVGPHRIAVVMHFWHAGPGGVQEMFDVGNTIDITVDGRKPVVIDASVVPQEQGVMPVRLRLVLGREGRPGAADSVSVEDAFAHFQQAPREQTPLPLVPPTLTTAGITTSIELELCFDERGYVSRVEPLSWAHPHMLGTHVEAVRLWRLDPLLRAGVPTAFCTAWRRTVEPESDFADGDVGY